MPTVTVIVIGVGLISFIFACLVTFFVSICQLLLYTGSSFRVLRRSSSSGSRNETAGTSLWQDSRNEGRFDIGSVSDRTVRAGD